MGTRSSIAIENEDGSVTSVYCHWDGYLSHNGVILLEAFSDRKKLANLLKKGDISSLGRKIGKKHTFDERPEDTCTFYRRDRGERNVKACLYPTRMAWIEGNRQEYNYLLTLDGEWLVSIQYGNTQLHSLKQAIENEEKENQEQANI